MRYTRRSSLTIAFIYDPKEYYHSLGFSDTECADLANNVTINGVASALKGLGYQVVHVPRITYLLALKHNEFKLDTQLNLDRDNDPQ